MEAPAAFPRLRMHRLVLELELFSDADWIRSDGPDLTQFRLDRGEVGATIGFDHGRGGAELRLESVRSAAEGGALGIDGDSLVARIKRAQVFGGLDVGGVHLEGAAGVIADAWIAALEDGYPLRPLSATASERLLDAPVSDLAAAARATLGPVRLAVELGNGEGLRYPERNSRQDDDRGARGRAARDRDDAAADRGDGPRRLDRAGARARSPRRRGGHPDGTAARRRRRGRARLGRRRSSARSDDRVRWLGRGSPRGGPDPRRARRDDRLRLRRARHDLRRRRGRTSSRGAM